MGYTIWPILNGHIIWVILYGPLNGAFMKKIFDKAEKNEVRNHVVDELGDFIAITGAKFKYQVLSA